MQQLFSTGAVRWRLSRLLAILLAVTWSLSSCSSHQARPLPDPTTTQPPQAEEEGKPQVESAQKRPTSTGPVSALPTSSPTPAEPLAAIVNGASIPLRELERRVAQQAVALLEQGLDLSTAEGQAQLEQMRRDVLESLIELLLVEQAAPSLDVSVTDEELEIRLEADIKAGGGQTAFDEWLLATGQTRADYEEALRQSLLTQRVLDAVTGDLPERAEQVHLRHILVDSEQAAQQVLERLGQGAEFTALASEVSLDPVTRESGGELGWFPRGLIAPELEAVAFALEPGEFSDVVQVGQGYHVLQLIAKEPQRPLSPEVRTDLIMAAFDRWLQDQKGKAAIERLVGP